MILDDITTLKQKATETEVSLKKIQADIQAIEIEKKDFSKVSSANDKTKMFAERVAKVTSEIANLEKKIKLYNEKRDGSEVKIDQCKRDIEELRAKIEKEEKRI